MAVFAKILCKKKHFNSIILPTNASGTVKTKRFQMNLELSIFHNNRMASDQRSLSMNAIN